MSTRTRPGMDAAISAMVDMAQSRHAQRRQASALADKRSNRVMHALARGHHVGPNGSPETLVIEARHHPLEPLHVRTAAKRPAAPVRRQEPVQQPAAKRVAIGDRATLAKAARARLAARKGTSEEQQYASVYAQPAGPPALSKAEGAAYANLFGNQDTTVQLTATESALFSKISNEGGSRNV